MRRAVVAASHSPKRRWTIVPSRSRDDTLAILRGQPIARLPVFGGLPSLTAPGLSAAGIRYGEAHTDPTMMARAAVRDVARALGYPYAVGDKISKLIPFGSQGFPITIHQALSITPELRDMIERDQDAKTIVTQAIITTVSAALSLPLKVPWGR